MNKIYFLLLLLLLASCYKPNMSIKTKSAQDTCHMDSGYVQEDSGYNGADSASIKYQEEYDQSLATGSPDLDTAQLITEPTYEHTVTPTRIQYNPKKQRLYKKYDLGN